MRNKHVGNKNHPFPTAFYTIPKARSYNVHTANSERNTRVNDRINRTCPSSIVLTMYVPEQWRRFLSSTSGKFGINGQTWREHESIHSNHLYYVSAATKIFYLFFFFHRFGVERFRFHPQCFPLVRTFVRPMAQCIAHHTLCSTFYAVFVNDHVTADQLSRWIDYYYTINRSVGPYWGLVAPLANHCICALPTTNGKLAFFFF
jgi:hypothetical protein